MYNTFSNISIEAIACTAPTKVLDNEKYAESIMDKRFKRRILYTGINQRHATIGNQRTSDLACIAAERLIEKLRWKKEEINVLVFVTQTPDLRTPSTAMLIQTKLGLSKDLLAFDVNLGCSGFTSGIQILGGILSQTKGKGLLLMGDCKHYPPGTEFDENQLLFGDGGAAAALMYDENAEDIQSFQMTDGSRFRAIYETHDKGASMDGNEIMLFSLSEVVEAINDFHEYYKIDRNDIDFYALHQAQKIIIDGIANICNIPDEKVLTIYDKYGNTSSASIPFSLCGNTNLFNKEKISVFACGYGIGLTWSGIRFSIKSNMVIPIIESDYYYPIIF